MKRLPFTAIGVITIALVISAIVANPAADPNGKTGVVYLEPGAKVEATDKALASYQAKLVERAFDAASTLPIRPHIKNRSRAQERVIEGCLKLDQPQRALRYAKGIDNWRRGKAYAQIATYLVESRDGANVENLLIHARQIANRPSLGPWRQNRIRMAIARTRMLLGQREQVNKLVLEAKAAHPTSLNAAKKQDKGYATEVTDAKGQVVKAMTTTKDAFDERMIRLNQLVEADNYEVIKQALQGYVELFEQFYKQTNLRSRAKSGLTRAWHDVPTFVRLNHALRLVNIALAHDNSDHALQLLADAREIFDSANWEIQNQLVYQARMARLQHAAGEQSEATETLKSLMSKFQNNKTQVRAFERASILRPIAEALAKIGETGSAVTTYQMALKEGAINPNLRPKADDLSKTCISMAVHGIQPREAMWQQIDTTLDELRDKARRLKEQLQ
jgi:tetratricopeptide (TPR) repeat protein